MLPYNFVIYYSDLGNRQRVIDYLISETFYSLELVWLCGYHDKFGILVSSPVRLRCT